MASCLAACSAKTGCVSVTMSGAQCYFRSTFSSRYLTTAANIASAVIYNPRGYARAAVSSGSSGCGQNPYVAAGANTVTVQFPFQGIARTFNIHVPAAYDPNVPAPLIFSMHGNGDLATNIETSTLLSSEYWNPFGIVVYPQGVSNMWQSDPTTLTATPYIDDLGFLTAITQNISSSFCVDKKRVWGSGFSNGGGMVGVLACNSQTSSLFNAFTAHSGAFYSNTTSAQCTGNVPDTMYTNNIVNSVCSPSNPSLPILEFHGDNDGTISYSGGARKGQCLPSLPHWVSDWASRNSLSTTPTVSTPVTNVTLSQYGSGAQLGLVSHYKIGGWSHNWAMKSGGAAIDATTVMLDWFYNRSA